jgi:hypothetical protein
MRGTLFQDQSTVRKGVCDVGEKNRAPHEQAENNEAPPAAAFLQRRTAQRHFADTEKSQFFDGSEASA